MVIRVIAGMFGVVCGAVVVGIVARYGYTSASTHFDGLISAVLFGIIATGGLVGHAVAVRIWRKKNKIGAMVIFLIATAALLVNLSNSLGFISGRSDVREAERAQKLEQSRRDNATLDRLLKERSTLPTFRPVTEAGVAAAKKAAVSAEKTRAAECTLRGQRCRDRETEVQQARSTVIKLETDLALTKQATDLDRKIETIQEKLERSEPVSAADAQTTALTTIFSLPAATASTYQKLIMALVAELLIVGAFLTVEWLRVEPAGGKTNQKPERQKRNQMAMKNMSVPKSKATDVVLGEVSDFIKACLEPHEESQVVIAELYQPYCDWCQANNLAVCKRTEFTTQFSAVVAEAGFPHQDGAVEFLKLKQAA